MKKILSGLEDVRSRLDLAIRAIERGDYQAAATELKAAVARIVALAKDAE